VAICEFLGGPRDGERFTVPGTPPPAQITVMVKPAGLRMWHPAEGDVPVVVCTLSHDSLGAPWKYRWPPNKPAQ
jgi:hypothetical protein